MMRRRSVHDLRVLRLRARRLLRLRSGRVASAFVKLRRESVGKPVEVFDAEKLKRMLLSGQPDDAHYYLQRFLPHGAYWSDLCTKLFLHVGVFKTLAKVVAGGEEGDKIASLFASPSNSYVEKPHRTGLDVMIAVIHADRTRGSILWSQKIKPEGMDRIMDLVARCPELQGEARVQFPRKTPIPWLKECPRRCRQTTNWAPRDLLIRAFLRKRLLLIQGKKHSALTRNLSSQSDTPYMKNIQIAPQPAVLEGVSHAPVVHHIPHIMTSPSKNPGILPSTTNAGVSHAPVVHHIPDILTSPSKNSGIFPSATNAVSGEQGANSTVLEKQGIVSLDLI